MYQMYNQRCRSGSHSIFASENSGMSATLTNSSAALGWTKTLVICECRRRYFVLTSFQLSSAANATRYRDHHRCLFLSSII
jgi:hypothetical protein